jgi:hypothetical protein
MNVPDVTRHTRRYWLIDGLPELFMGGLFVLFSALQFTIRFLPASVAGWVQILIPVFIIVFALAGRPVIQAIKVRITYPHTGYVEYPKPTSVQQILGMLFGFVITALLLAWAATTPISMAMLPVLIGVLTAFMLLYLGFYLGAWRFYVMAALSVVISGGVMLLPIDGQAGYLLIFAIMGLVLLVSGAYTFRQYRRRYTTPEEKHE